MRPLKDMPRVPFDPASVPDSPVATLPGWSDPVTFRELVEWRRDVHRYPEVGWGEFMATAKIASFFEKLGFDVRVGREFINPEYVLGRNREEVWQYEQMAIEAGIDRKLLTRMGGLTGCIAVFDTGRPGQNYGLRVELDAIKMTEPEDPDHLPFKEGFASVHRGAMHACAHDGHQAVACELARFIIANKARLGGRYTFVFQPGEEGSRGASPIVKSGAVDDIDVMLHGHIATERPLGTVFAAPQKFFCTTKLDFKFTGQQSHAGMLPQTGRNALLAAANTSLLLMALPRHSDGSTRVNVGRLIAGEGRNVVASHALMEVEVRGANERINAELAREAVRRAQGAALSFGVECEYTVMGEASDFVPDESITQMITVCARRARFVEEVEPKVSLNTSDDVTLMMRRVQSHGGRAGYFVVGGAIAEESEHSALDFDERALVTLYDVYTNMIVGLAGSWDNANASASS